MPDELRKRKPGWVDRLSPKTKLILATLLGVAIGLEIGVLVSRGGMEALYDYFSGEGDHNILVFEIAYGFLFIGICKACYYGGIALWNSKWPLLGRGTVAIIAFIAYLIIYRLMEEGPGDAKVLALFGLIIFWAFVYMCGRVPMILQLSFWAVWSLLFDVIGFSTESPTYLGLIMLWGFLLYPTQISLKRFIIPSRGVI